jgi:hypothetical protein
MVLMSVTRFARHRKRPTRPSILNATPVPRGARRSLHVVKIVFPRGDAASLMMGLNADAKITGISLMSMVGD